MQLKNNRIPDILPEILHRTVKDHPEQGIGFVHPDRSIHFVTYPQLLEQAMGMLAGLQSRGLQKGSFLIISIDQCKEIIPVLWACFIGGIVPALLQPPVTFTEYNPAAEKAGKVFHILDRPYVIFSHTHYESWKTSHVPSDLLLDVAGIHGNPDEAKPADLHPDDLVLIQFSSGSTGDPKGIMLTHMNIIVNTFDITTGLKLKPFDVSTSWMPLYHDMGLLGFHITPVYNKCSHYLINPIDFVKNPLLWLDILHEKKTSISACPSFGQILVNRALKRRVTKDWDLSHLRVVFNAAEPISVSIMQEFLQNLKEYNLHPEAMFPAYGLAEATLAVTFASLEKEAEVVRFQRISLLRLGMAVPADPIDDNIIELVNLGKPLTNCQVRIVNDQGKELGERSIGTVLVKGPNVSSGYYKNAHATKTVFQDGWLHTGDLGFIYKRDLYIMGRSKDIIFINGTNYYAHDIETVMFSVDGIVPGKVVVAGYFDEVEGRDKLLVFLVGSDNDTMRSTFLSIRNQLQQTLGLHPEGFIPIKSNDIPRTSSGKIQRFKMVNRFLQGAFSIVKL
jgi:acyl-CoA synthetase (AMP-forming)/AMP-acid ligase II